MARSAPTSVLTALGFTPAVDRLYQQVRTHSGRQLPRVAAATLRTPGELLEDLDPLVRAGIVRLDGDELVVEPPAEALRIMVAAQAVHAERTLHRLEGLAEAVALLADEAHVGLDDHDETMPIDGEVVTASDPTRIYAMVRDLVRHSRGDLLWLRPDQWRSPNESKMAALVEDALRQGGRTSRAIYPLHVTREAPGVLAARAAAGEEVRLLPVVPSRMLVIGDTHVLLPDRLGYADIPLVVVRQTAVVEAAAQWFELLWERAATPAAGRPEARRDLRRFLLQQLADGAHDEQIARNLGISLRTVRRRVADLMLELGADTRFQAGVEATRRGWL
ncbi:helix-turn-helix domain-containing protein [Nocardioides sp. SR21]|uniref:helix-turn-helix transcriptional regulator n=1 Tax=Nocardioides sp. SR21 TaxID=2919501 RepID=UPI001FAAAEA9|nr:helix-turn-helix domain-containing protein [Nocardioides sp. SR21]